MVINISVNELIKKIKLNERVAVLDARNEEDYNQGHISGAIHLNMNKVLEIVSQLKEEIVVVCYSGGRSSAICDYLSKNKILAKSLQGGMSEWKKLGLPLTN